ncbi:transposase [Paenibacillus sp. FSL L8-0436]|uniref:transposase n=1 Tax=Paenibacillus sp. FSL L8-0436 TaxID=2954686 RepID=UPI00315889B9
MHKKEISAGQTLHFRKESKETLESGYEIRKRHYRSQSCEGCPLKERCTKAEGNREVVVSLERLRYQSQAREILRSEEGYALAVRRMTEPESVFSQLKNNRRFRRFLLRGTEKAITVKEIYFWDSPFYISPIASASPAGH